MLYAGIDYHKSYSLIQVKDGKGVKQKTSKLPNDFEAVKDFFEELNEPCKAVLEAGYNWGKMYDWLDQIESLEEIQLAHPSRVKAIASAQVKTDTVDAGTLADLLRANLIPQAYIPSKETRALKDLVRQRLFLVRMRTMMKNRIHVFLDKHHISPPPASDILGKRGCDYLAKVTLEPNSKEQLDQDLRLLQTLNTEIRQTEKILKQSMKDDRRIELLLTIPGLGIIISTVLALEIDDIHRFPNAKKLAAYAGLVPSVHASGGKIHHGRLMKQSNKWLRWALVEAAWVAVRRDPYFRTLYGKHSRKGSQTAIVVTARRLLEVVWHVLAEDRPYEPRPVSPAKRKKLSCSPAALTKD